MRFTLFAVCLWASLLAVSAVASPFNLGAASKSLALTRGVNHADVPLPITPAGGGFDYGQVQVSSNAAWVTPAVDVAGQKVILKFTTAALTTGSPTATITATHGADTVTITLNSTTRGLNVSKLMDDPCRLRMYGIQINTGANGSLLVIDPETGKVLGSITVGRRPTGMAISDDGSELFVIDAEDKTISVVDLEMLAVSESLALPVFGGWGSPFVLASISTGPEDILYYTDGSWGQSLHVYRRSSQQVVQSINFGISNFSIAHFILNKEKTRLFTSSQLDGSSMAYRSYLARYEVAGNGTLTAVELTPPMDGAVDTSPPLLLDDDSENLFAYQSAFNPESLSTINRAGFGSVYSISPDGEMVVTETGVSQFSTGGWMMDLPVSTFVHAVTSDYSRLVYFERSSSNLKLLDLEARIGMEAMGRVLSPANEAIIHQPDSFVWTGQFGATAFHVYFGHSQAEVKAATPASPAYLGATVEPAFAAPGGLVDGSTYYWRVDEFIAGKISQGIVRSFTVSPIATSVSRVVTSTLKGYANHQVDVQMQSALPGQAWAATADQPWVTFISSTGTAPGDLEIRLDASQLDAGLHTALITVSGESGTFFTLPVQLTVEAVYMGHLRSDPLSSIIYAISENQNLSLRTAFLLEVDTATETLLRVVPVGMGVSDMAIHAEENRIYITNSAHGKLLALNKTTLAQERIYEHGKFKSITPGKAGRIVVGESDYDPDTVNFDTVNGVKLGVLPLPEGMGAFDPTGQIYYHGTKNSTSAELARWEVIEDAFTKLRTVYNHSAPSTEKLVVSEDGQKIFWRGKCFNAGLDELWELRDMFGADTISSTSEDGRLAFGGRGIYDSVTGVQIMSMPRWTMSSAFNTTTQKLVLINGTQLQYYPVALPITFTAPVLSVASRTTTSLRVSWTDANLETHFNLQYRLAGAPDWLNATGYLEENQTTTTLSGLPPNTAYEIRIQAASPGVTSPWSNVLLTQTRPTPPPTVNFTNLTTSATGLRLSFTTTNNPSSILVERALAEDGPWTVLDTLPGTAIYYTDLNVELEITYFYRIQAARDGVSTISTVRSFLLPIPILGLQSPFDYNQGIIRVSGSNSNPGFHTLLQRRQGESGDWTTVVPVYLYSWDPWHLDADTLPGTTYYYRLMVLPEILPDVVSNIVSYTTPQVSPPLPMNFRVTHITGSQIDLGWSPASLETGFRIERQSAFSNTWSLLATVEANATTYPDSTVVNGDAYRYRLTAFNEFGDSPSAETLQVTADNTIIFFEDDFDPQVDTTQWIYLPFNPVQSGGEGHNGSNVLKFNYGSTRYALTKALDTRRSGVIEFSMRAGNNDPLGGWQNSEPGDEVVLEYMTDNISWQPIQEIDTVYPALSYWTQFSIPIPEAARTTATHFRWRQKESEGTFDDVWALDNVVIRTARKPALHFVSPPVSQLVLAGSPAILDATVNSPLATYKWYKDSQLIPDADRATYAIPNAQPAHGGSYTCEARYGDLTLETGPLMLGVIAMTEASDPIVVKLNGSFSLGMEVRPASLEDELTFVWTRNEDGDLAGIGSVSGEQTSSLTVSGATMVAEATYHCLVTYEPDSSLEVGPYEVRVRLLPAIQSIQDMDVVSGSPVDIAVVTTDHPVSIQVRGLPKGLTYDPATQRIVGSVTGNKSYTITVDASNDFGAAAPVTFQLNVVGFPAALAGTYRGVFTDPGSEPAFRYGAQAAFKITAKGAGSGTVMIQGKNCRFVSKNMAADPGGAWGRLKAIFKDPQGSPLLLDVHIITGAALHEAVLRTGGEGGSQLLTAGKVVRNQWSKANAAPSAGLINAALLPPVLEEGLINDTDAPRGVGFLNLKLTPQGTVTCKGRLADGQAVTGSTVMGPEGHMPIFVSLHRGTGAFGTLMSYSPSGQASGTAWWGKDGQGPSSKDRVHKNGFLRHELTLTGGQYQRPAANTPVFASQADVPTPATLTLTCALLPDPGITQVLSFTGKHQADVPRESALNPYGITLKVKAATGTFTGKFKLEEPNPLKPNATLRRTVTFQGSLIPGLERGCGYFLLPELPSADIPRNPPMWSGRVEILPAEVE